MPALDQHRSADGSAAGDHGNETAAVAELVGDCGGNFRHRAADDHRIVGRLPGIALAERPADHRGIVDPELGEQADGALVERRVALHRHHRRRQSADDRRRVAARATDIEHNVGIANIDRLQEPRQHQRLYQIPSRRNGHVFVHVSHALEPLGHEALAGNGLHGRDHARVCYSVG